MMTVAQFIALRKTLGLTQKELAEAMGLSVRALHDIENEGSKLRPIHVLAVERIALAFAVERQHPMFAPSNVRSDATRLAAMLTGWPEPVAVAKIETQQRGG